MNLETLLIILKFSILGLIGIFIVELVFKKFKFIKNKISFIFLKNLLKLFIILVVVFNIGMLFEGFRQASKTALLSSGFLIAALAFAFQKGFENVIAGFMMSIFPSFALGDRINLVDRNIVGFVEDITTRHTVIRTFYNTKLIVPNSVISNEIIENSNMAVDRVGSPIDIAIMPGEDIDKAIEIMELIIEEHDKTLDTRDDKGKVNGERHTKVYINRVDQYGINLRATIWTIDVNDNFETSSQIRQKIINKFKEEKIELANIYLLSKNEYKK